MTSDTVRRAGAIEDINHREPAFQVLFLDLRHRLLQVYKETAHGWRAYVLGGSGTAAMEAMLTSVVSVGPILLISNGYYSERFQHLIDIYDIPFQHLRASWRDPLDLNAIESALAGDKFEAVIVTHHETTTGRLNDVQAIGRLAHHFGARCLVDSISSFGADFIDFSAVDVLCGSANKCLHGLPGVSFVLCRESIADEIGKQKPRTFYLHLPRYEGESPPLTPPVPALASFRQALVEIGPGGANDRRRVYESRIARFRSALESWGCDPILRAEESSASLVTATLPKGFDIETWFRFNLDAGFVIYRCKGDFAETHFHVSSMGEIPDSEIDRWCALRPMDR
jgi:2-aminoethylphosphonate-pyruvate transaminase